MKKFSFIFNGLNVTVTERTTSNRYDYFYRIDGMIKDIYFLSSYFTHDDNFIKESLKRNINRNIETSEDYM